MGTYPWVQRNISRACDCAVRRLYRRVGGVLRADEKWPGNAFGGKSAAPRLLAEGLARLAR